jgi:hypothetical protein
VRIVDGVFADPSVCSRHGRSGRVAILLDLLGRKVRVLDEAPSATSRPGSRSRRGNGENSGPGCVHTDRTASGRGSMNMEPAADERDRSPAATFPRGGGLATP